MRQSYKEKPKKQTFIFCFRKFYTKIRFRILNIFGLYWTFLFIIDDTDLVPTWCRLGADLVPVLASSFARILTSVQNIHQLLLHVDVDIAVADKGAGVVGMTG